MPTPILMPALSPTMTEGNLAKWLKNEGDSVKSGDIIAEIETDKSTMEVEAVDEGILAKILVPEGTSDVPVNQKIAILAGDGEDAKQVAATGGASMPGEPETSEAVAEPAPAQPAAYEPAVAASGDPSERVPAAPASPPGEGAYDASQEIPAGTEMVTMTVRE